MSFHRKTTLETCRLGCTITGPIQFSAGHLLFALKSLLVQSTAATGLIIHYILNTLKLKFKGES